MEIESISHAAFVSSSSGDCRCIDTPEEIYTVFLSHDSLRGFLKV
jgi:hypothetical protein